MNNQEINQTNINNTKRGVKNLINLKLKKEEIKFKIAYNTSPREADKYVLNLSKKYNKFNWL